MATTTPTLIDIRQAVIKLAKANPDAIYQRPEGKSCKYNSGHSVNPDNSITGTGCIFGQAFRQLGFEMQREGDSIAALLEKFGIIPINFDVHDLIEVQKLQDSSIRWGECIELIKDK